MKIALVCPYDWVAPGGVQAHVRNLAVFLEDDHEVLVVTPSSSLPSEAFVQGVGRPAPVRFNRSVVPVSASPLAVRRTLRLLRGFSPHVVHVHEPAAPVVAIAATWFGPRPLVGTFHTWSERTRAYRLAAPITRRAVARLDARIAVSPAAQEYAARVLGLRHSTFTVVPNGVDFERYANAEPIADLADPDRPLLLFVGRLEPRKGLEVAIRAFLRLRAARPAVRLCVVGDGPQRDRCQQMVPPSIRPDVLFVGRVAEADKPRYHASADIFLAPNVTGESFGIVLLEAMAAELPVVASDIPGFRGLVQDGRQGLLVPPGDAVSMANALQGLLDNQRLRQAMAAEGRVTAAAHAWNVVGRRLVEVYRSVL